MLNFEIRKKYFTMLAKKISDIYEIITGIPPLSLPNSKGKNLKSYSISGNTDEEIIGFSGSDVVLPDGYRQLEYIQTDGNSYINTNVIPFNAIGVDVTFYSLSSLSTATSGDNVYGCIYGSRVSSNVSEIQLTTWSGVAPSNTGLFAAGTTANAKIPAGISVKTKQTVTFKNLEYTSPRSSFDHTFDSFDWNNSGNVYPIFIGALNDAGTAKQGGKGTRIYEFIIYNGNDIFRRFVPCANAENTVGMYEIIEGKFYGNAGTGTFTKSPFNLLRTLGRTEQAVSGNAQTKRILQGDKWAKLTFNNYVSSLQSVTLGNGSVSFSTGSGGHGVGFPVKLKPNHKYTAYANVSAATTTATMNIRISFYEADGTWISTWYQGKAVNSGMTLKSFDVPNNADMTLISCARNNYESGTATTLTFSDIMLIEGTYTTSNAPAYTPYKQLLTDCNGVGDYDNTTNRYKIPVLSSGTHNIIINNSLYKIGKNIDTVNYPQNKTVKAVGKYVFTGNEAIELYDNSKGFRFAVSDMETGNCIDGFCNRFENFKNMTDNNVPRVFFGYNNNYVYFRRFSDTATTAEAIKATLADWYSSGKPLTIWYPLEDETEEAVTLPDIPTVQGNATIIVDTSVQPSEMSVEYAIEGA